MLLDICFGSKSVWRILLVLSKPPGRGVTREEIKKFTKLGSKMLTDKLRILLEFDIIKSVKEGKKTYYKLNLANKFAEKIIELCDMENENLLNLDFGIGIIIREFTRKVLEFAEVEKILVFGSHVKRTAHKESDIDVAIILKRKYTKSDLLIIEKASEEIEERFGKNVQTHIFYADEFEKLRKMGDKLVEEIIRDGIRLV